MENFHLQEDVLMNYLGDFQRRRRRDFFDLVDREFIETTRLSEKNKKTYFYDDKYEGRIPQNIGQQTVGQIPKTNVSVAQECST